MTLTWLFQGQESENRMWRLIGERWIQASHTACQRRRRTGISGKIQHWFAYGESAMMQHRQNLPVMYRQWASPVSRQYCKWQLRKHHLLYTFLTMVKQFPSMYRREIMEQ